VATRRVGWVVHGSGSGGHGFVCEGGGCVTAALGATVKQGGRGI